MIKSETKFVASGVLDSTN